MAWRLSLVHGAPSLPLPSPSARIRSYLALTKPRIVELLLVTTVPTMFVAARGVPSFGLMAATLVMAMIVVTINRLLWRRLYALASTRFKLEA